MPFHCSFGWFLNAVLSEEMPITFMAESELVLNIFIAASELVLNILIAANELVLNIFMSESQPVLNVFPFKVSLNL